MLTAIHTVAITSITPKRGHITRAEHILLEWYSCKFVTIGIVKRRLAPLIEVLICAIGDRRMLGAELNRPLRFFALKLGLALNVAPLPMAPGAAFNRASDMVPPLPGSPTADSPGLA